MSEAPQRSPGSVLLTALIKRWLIVSLALLVLFSVGEVAGPSISRPGAPHWLTLLWTFGTRFSLGLAVGSLLIALLLLQQRSCIGRR